MTNRFGLGIGLALMAASLYGLIPSLARAAYDHGVPAVESAFFRTTLAAVLLGLAALLSGQRQRLVVPRAARRSFFIQAAATATISICYMASVQFIPVGLAVVIFFICPVLILLTAPLVEGSSPGFARIMLALFAFAGLAIAIGPSFDRLDGRGLALAGAAAIGYALQFFSGRAISQNISPIVLGSLVHAAIWPVTLAAALWAGGGQLQIVAGAAESGYIAMTALALCYMLAYCVHMQALANAPASAIAPVFNLEPVVTTAVAAFALGERLSPNQYLGGAMVLAALIGASLFPRRA